MASPVSRNHSSSKNSLGFRTLFVIAARNAVLNWRHSLAALLSIVSGFLALCLFQGYIYQVVIMYSDVFTRRGMLGNMIIEKKGADGRGFFLGPEFDLAEKDQAIIDEYLSSHGDQLKQRVRFLNVSGMITNGKSNAIFAGYGYDTQDGGAMRAPAWSWNTVAGVPLDRATTEERLVMGLTLGEMLDCNPVHRMHLMTGVGGYPAEDRPFTCATQTLQLSTTTADGRANAINPTLVGLVDAAFKDIDARFVAMPLASAQSLMGSKSVSYYTAELKDPTMISAFVSGMKEFSHGRGLELDLTPWQEHRFGELYVKSIDFLNIFRNFILTVILAIVLLSVFNTLTKLVLERTREAGTLRSLGFGQNWIVSMFAVEGAILAAIGCAVGTGLVFIVMPLINALKILYKAGVLSEPAPFLIGMKSGILFSSALLLCTISILAAAIPAYRVSRLKIPKALEHA